jgi:iron complex outermembrane receptor protein
MTPSSSLQHADPSVQPSILLAIGLAAGLAFSPVQQARADIDTVVVSATRTAETSADLPASVDSLGRELIQTGHLQVNLSETLDQVAGVNAQLRQNYAQDLQISIRGFGARSAFGVSGVRLYSDGIPGTMPDGQGQFSQFDLGSAGRIEVLRGPFSVLYGNASGGVISIFTEDGAPGFGLLASVTEGSYATQRYSLKGSGDTGGLNYVIDASHFQTDGYRQHSAAERNNFNSKFRIELRDGATLTFVANAVETPFVQDPLGLTYAQWLVDPRQAPVAITYNTRKSLGQEQAGVIYATPLNSQLDLTSTTYVGARETTQFQAIPQTTQAVASSPGGVIELNRSFWGTDAHATWHYDAVGPLKVTLGASYDGLDEARHSYLNFLGSTLGVEGPLRAALQNHVYDLNGYLQAQWDPSPRWRAIAGVRNSVVIVESDNLLQASGMGPHSSVRYSATDPVAGLTFRATSLINLYASYGKGFETPTLNNLAYRSTNGSLPGLNLGLEPARSDNYEAGIKAGDAQLSGTLAAFHIKTQDELAVAANSGGRSVYTNIGETQRKGAELSLDGHWAASLSSHLAYTYLQATTQTPYSTCVTLPCVPVVIPVGNRLPAVPENSLYAGLTWQPSSPGLSATVEAIARAKMYADDRNSVAAPGYWLLNAHLNWQQPFPGWRLSEMIRLDNIANRRYVGSVIVNDSNSRFFEAEPGRTVYVGIQAKFGN